MADFQQDLMSYLQAQPGIAALVGYATLSRIYPQKARQGAALPHIVLSEAGGESPELLVGRGGAGIVQSTWHVYAVADNQAGANALAEEIRISVQGFRGLMGSTYVNEVSCSTHRDSGDDTPVDGSDASKYWVRRIYDIWHEQRTI